MLLYSSSVFVSHERVRLFVQVFVYLSYIMQMLTISDLLVLHLLFRTVSILLADVLAI